MVTDDFKVKYGNVVKQTQFEGRRFENEIKYFWLIKSAVYFFYHFDLIMKANYCLDVKII